MTSRLRVAFVKYAGMTAGGTERWLQTIAAHLPRDRFDVTYFWSGAAAEIGSSRRAPATDPHRLASMHDAGLDLVEFHVQALDLRRPTAPWKETDFWELFDPSAFDLVQTSKVGLPEYPFVDMPVPVFEFVAYNGGVDPSPSIVRSGHPSQWSRAWWCHQGGRLDRSFVHPVPASPPAARGDLRDELGIDADALVVGFHQRPDDGTMSPVQLAAVAALGRSDIHVVVLGGSALYQQQARQLGLAHCHFLPPTGDGVRISQFLQTLDVFTHGRRDGETFGLVLAEAMVHGLPCLSHRVPGNANAQRETIGPGGDVVDDVAGYEAALRILLDDPETRSVVSERGRKHATQRFSTAAAVEAQAAEYESFIAGRRPPKTWGYGEVPQGFLLSGTVEDPHDPAAAIVTGALDASEVIAALTEVLPAAAPGPIVLTADLRPVVLWLATRSQHGRRVTIHETLIGTCRELLVDLRLNGVEEAVEVRHHPECAWAGADIAAANLPVGTVVVACDGLADGNQMPAGDLILVRGWAASEPDPLPPGMAVRNLRSGRHRWTVTGRPTLVNLTEVAFRQQASVERRRRLNRAAARRALPVRQWAVAWWHAGRATARALR